MSVSGTTTVAKKFVPAADTPPPRKIRPHAGAEAFSAAPTSVTLFIKLKVGF